MSKASRNSRRHILQAGLAMGGLSLFGARGLAQKQQTGSPVASSLKRCTPKGDLLTALLTGNRHFAIAWQEIRSISDPSERALRLRNHLNSNCQVDPQALEQGQQPWAAVLTCSDSRIPLEWMFGVGDGEIFGVRSAGNTAFAEGIASLEYAVAVLQVPVILVMGHRGCGAVKAALSRKKISSPLLRSLVEQISSNTKATNNLEDAVKANIQATVEQIKSRSTLLSEAIQNKSVSLASAYFDIDLGTVELLRQQVY